MTAINKTFLDKAETPFIALQKLMIVQLKEAPVLQTPLETVVPHKHSNTKQESVGLPEFKGEEKKKELSPYLKYPVWRKQWDVLIVGYDEDWRSSIFNQKLDDAARNTFVGYENDYNEAMKRLDKFYGNINKVVEYVMKEVCSPREIAEGDYKGLLAYTTILENNFNRLRSLNHEHELSNTMQMSSILRKFPRSISEKWIEFLSGLSSSEATRPFPNFIAWLGSQRIIWEGMVVVDQKFNSKSSSSFFGDGNSNDNNGSGGSGGGGPKCYQCGEEGHKRFQCPKSQMGEKKPPRGEPKHKKFSCAFHKNDSSRRCYSVSCQDLRKMTDSNKRLQLLKENNDCKHCCGDHKDADCNRKSRVCGGGKDGLGCSRPHNVHELFCTSAKVCMSMQSVYTSRDQEEGVLLLIMNVRVAKKGMWASVFWDL